MKKKRWSLRRWLSALLVVTMLLSMALQVSADGPDLNDVVPDMALRALINDKLSTEEKPRQPDAPISKEDMEKLEGADASALTQTVNSSQGMGTDNLDDISKKGLCSDGLDPSQKTIKNLEGLQYATNLKSLDLSGNQIADLTPLKGLTNLTFLDLSRNQIVDISPLMNFLKRAQEEGKEYFVWLAAQTDPGWNAPTLEATPEGGTVPVPNSGFPVIGQLAKLEQGKSQVTFQRNLMVSAASLNGVTVGFAADNKAMEAKFAKRLYQPLENEVILTIQGTGTD